jgi:hypothetical protein
MGAKARAATLYSVAPALGADHEAVIRFSGEAPRWRAHSQSGVANLTMEDHGLPPPRIVIGGPSYQCCGCRNLYVCARCCKS